MHQNVKRMHFQVLSSSFGLRENLYMPMVSGTSYNNPPHPQMKKYSIDCHQYKFSNGA